MRSGRMSACGCRCGTFEQPMIPVYGVSLLIGNKERLHAQRDHSQIMPSVNSIFEIFYRSVLMKMSARVRYRYQNRNVQPSLDNLRTRLHPRNIDRSDINCEWSQAYLPLRDQTQAYVRALPGGIQTARCIHFRRRQVKCGFHRQ